MKKEEFYNFVKKEFLAAGLKKKGNYYYISGNEIFCELWLQGSVYGGAAYINYYFFLDNDMLAKGNGLPSRAVSDIEGRFGVISKTPWNDGKLFITSMIEYEKYEENELKYFLCINLESFIFPALRNGKKFILENLDKLYYLTLNKDDVLNKLQH